MDYHLDARMPRPEQCVQRYMIERWAREQPDKLFAIFADGEQWTYGEMQANAIRTANALRALGVKQGERVLVWLPNSADCLRDLVRPQLSRRGVRTDQHRLSRRPARACDRLVGSAADDRACRSLPAAQ